jgi:hypothetical protein
VSARTAAGRTSSRGTRRQPSNITGVSVPVTLDQLREEVVRFGSAPYLISVTSDGRPHAVSVTVTWDGDELAADAGRTTLANAAERPSVSLLWSPVEPGGYSLIVDGLARVDAAAERVVVQPGKAVLHRSRSEAPGSDCVTVLPS